MSKYWSKVVRELEPYVPGEQPKISGLIKLNTNESPYPPSPKVKQVLANDNIDLLRLYPDPNCETLREKLAEYYSVSIDEVFVGNGSDDVLAQLFMAFFQQKEPILFPDITYSFYEVYCQLFNVKAKRIPLADDFTLNLSDYGQANGGIIFPNPNAPTGIGTTLIEIEALLAVNTESVVVVDEAYVDFGGQSAISLVPKFENLLVVQTLSKSRALAGMRVGFAIGNKSLIEGLNRVKNSYNSYPLDRLAQLTAIAAVEDEEYFQAMCKKTIHTREYVIEALLSLDFTVLPSQANFVFVRPPENIAAETLAQKLRQEKIIVRFFNKPRVNEYLRISIGTDKDMLYFINTLKSIL